VKEQSNIATKLAMAMLMVSAASVAVVLGISLVLWKEMPPQIPLFYSMPWGEEQLAAPIWLFLPLAISIIIGLATYWIFRLRLITDLILGNLIYAALMSTSLILLLGVIRILVIII
jgi:hypothetical protein